MKRILLSLLFSLSIPASQAETWRFALIGDTPYSVYERRQLPAMIEAIAATHPEFIVHAGDFKSSNSVCSDTLFENRRQVFDASPVPFVYVPGDNEWTDCSRVLAGHFVPAERLAKLRELFMPADESLGQRRIALQRQPGDYREHQRWRLGPVLFVTLNVPGGNNYLLNGLPGDEATARMPHVLSWLRDGFALARHERLAGIVVVMQADPGFKEFTAHLPRGSFRQLLQTLRDETLAFPGQVVLVHGDTHWQRIDRPLRHPASNKPLANFTRVETFGYPFMGWVGAVIDNEDPALFHFDAHPWPAPRP